ncbi:tRNA-specific 2-thiouridylase [Marinilabilia salmonicolor]|jgi:tRNA-specific 2-thiouridylase|uniref:tRNA 2-thiouridine(34) synthase MnmA n=1 Tax=Marinilabilia salmonicolor TaxID=989 RepID=UPI000D077C32|nr:tRNA 2-thiouridine(34) synthase MnmA [Marinilabilia salmonicolor]PRZ00387.1 tRNA-specific 2-thiouridylase [Marinilabilia salmonicolor]
MQVNNRILLGMSGGLDSTMSALLLKQQGYQVIGLTLKTWHLHPGKYEQELQKAASLAKKLNIEHSILDISRSFHEEVVDYFCREYQTGRTPNPCNRCNPVIKWPWLIKKAEELNCRFVATGHYVQKVKDNGKWYIKKGADPSKDQSYFLWNLSQEILEKAIFPLGNLTKSEVRQMALDYGLKETARKQESMGVCFLGGTNYRDFLTQKQANNELTIHPGKIVDEEGNILGTHRGLAFFTIGQKKGLGLPDKKFFVKEMGPETNRIIVSKTATLSTSTLKLTEFNLIPNLEENRKYQVDIRIRGIDKVPSLPGFITLHSDKLLVDFEEEAWGITPGQSIVFYQKNIVIGGGLVIS